MHPYVHSSTIHNSQDMETTQMSINRWMDKENGFTYTMEYHSAIKKNEIMPFAATWMDLDRDYHVDTKWSKSERERQIPYNITYMQNLKYDTNEPIYKTETDSQT